MRYPASEKLEIIRLVEQSHLGVGSTLDKLGIPKTTFYRWYDRFLAFGDAGLEDRNSSPGRVWNRIPDDVRGQIIDLALEGRCHVNHRVTSLWAPTPEIMQRSSLAATVSSRRCGIGGVFGGRPDGVGR